jgi:hypothetical protein
MERENIQSFCTAARAYGLAAEDIFSIDAYGFISIAIFFFLSIGRSEVFLIPRLYDAKDLICVLRTLLALKRKAPAPHVFHGRLENASTRPVAVRGKPVASKSKVRSDDGDADDASSTTNPNANQQPPIAIFAPSPTASSWSFTRALVPVVIGVGGGLGAAFGAGLAIPVAVGVGVVGAIVFGGVRYAMGY